jgi:hypothetical protein
MFAQTYQFHIHYYIQTRQNILAFPYVLIAASKRDNDNKQVFKSVIRSSRI